MNTANVKWFWLIGWQFGLFRSFLHAFTRGNHAPGIAAVATGCNLLVAQARYCNSFQLLMHMPNGNHAQSIASNGGQREDSAHNCASTVSFGMYASVNDSDHGRVVRIFVCLS